MNNFKGGLAMGSKYTPEQNKAVKDLLAANERLRATLTKDGIINALINDIMDSIVTMHDERCNIDDCDCRTILREILTRRIGDI